MAFCSSGFISLEDFRKRDETRELTGKLDTTRGELINWFHMGTQSSHVESLIRDYIKQASQIPQKEEERFPNVKSALLLYVCLFVFTSFCAFSARRFRKVRHTG